MERKILPPIENRVGPHHSVSIHMPDDNHKDAQPKKKENLIATKEAKKTNTEKDIKDKGENENKTDFAGKKSITERENCIESQQKIIQEQEKQIEKFIKFIEKREADNNEQNINMTTQDVIELLEEEIKKLKKSIEKKKTIGKEKMKGNDLGHKNTKNTKMKGEKVPDEEAGETLNGKRFSNDKKQESTSVEEAKSNNDDKENAAEDIEIYKGNSSSEGQEKLRASKSQIHEKENKDETGKIDKEHSSNNDKKQWSTSYEKDTKSNENYKEKKDQAFQRLVDKDDDEKKGAFLKFIKEVEDIANDTWGIIQALRQVTSQKLRTNIKRQKESFKEHKESIENIASQKRIPEEIGSHSVVSKQDDIKRNDVLMILAGAMMVFASLLVAWGDLTEGTPFCEREEALKSINITYPMSCRNENFREKISRIKEIGISSLCLDFLFLSVGFMFVSPGCRRYGLTVLYFYLAFESAGFAGTLLNTYKEMQNLRPSQQDPDNAEIKNIMLKALRQTYSSDDTIDTHTASGKWNAFFIKHDCCAVNQVMGTTNDFDTTPWCTTFGSCQLTNSQIPKACCKGVTKDDFQNAPSSCHASVTDGTYKDSCLKQLISLGDVSIEEYQILVLCSCLFILGTMKIAACLIAVEMIVIYIICFLRKKCCFKTDSKVISTTNSERKDIKADVKYN